MSKRDNPDERAFAPTILAAPAHPLDSTTLIETDPLSMLLAALEAKAKAAEAQVTWAAHSGTTEQMAVAAARADAYGDTLRLVRGILKPQK